MKAKVAEITQERVTPFTNGIPGKSWLKWFRARHPTLVLRVPQGLDYKRARAVNPTSCAEFYNNLGSLYDKHSYPPYCIWNIDETGCSASQSGLAKVFAKKGIKGVHKTMPSEREWLSILTAINASGETIPHYYIFKGVRQLRNYVIRCEEGASQGMQKKGWMDSIRFLEWMEYFIQGTRAEEEDGPRERQLIILDGHKSHITLEVLELAKNNGIDMVSLPSHSSHELQPLDKACFKPFKVAFRAYRDIWNLQNHGKKCETEDLAQWASLAFKKALTTKNIDSGFRVTGIWPLNPLAMQHRTGPSEPFQAEFSENDERDQILQEGLPTPREGLLHYYGCPSEEEEDLGREEQDVRTQDLEEEGQLNLPNSVDLNPSQCDIQTFLRIPRAKRIERNVQRNEPLVDYSQSQQLTSDQHVLALQSIVAKKEALQQLKLDKQREKEEKKKKKIEEKEANKTRRAAEKEQRRMAKEAQGHAQVEKMRARGKQPMQQQPPSRQGEVLVNPPLQTPTPPEFLYNPHILSTFRPLPQPQNALPQPLLRPGFNHLPWAMVPPHLWPPPP